MLTWRTPPWMMRLTAFGMASAILFLSFRPRLLSRSAEDQLVNSLYEYNQAKLGLARNLGIIDRDYRAYLGVSNQTTQLHNIPDPHILLHSSVGE